MRDLILWLSRLICCIAGIWGAITWSWTSLPLCFVALLLIELLVTVFDPNPNIGGQIVQSGLKSLLQSPGALFSCLRKMEWRKVFAFQRPSFIPKRKQQKRKKKKKKAKEKPSIPWSQRFLGFCARLRPRWPERWKISFTRKEKSQPLVEPVPPEQEVIEEGTSDPDPQLLATLAERDELRTQAFKLRLTVIELVKHVDPAFTVGNAVDVDELNRLAMGSCQEHGVTPDELQRLREESQEAGRLRTDIDQLRIELEQGRESLLEARQELTQTKSQVQGLTEQLESVTEQAERVPGLLEQLETVQEQLKSSGKQVQQLKTQLDDTQGTHAKVLEEVQRRASADLQAATHRGTQELDRLRQRADTDLSQVNQRVTEVTKERDKALTEAASLGEQLETLQARLEWQSQPSSTRGVRDLSSPNQKSDSQLRAEITKLRRDAEESGERHKKELREATTDHDRLVTDLRNVTRERDELAMRLGHKNTQIVDMAREVAPLQKKAEQAEKALAELAEARNEMLFLSVLVDSLESENRELEAEIEELEFRLDTELIWYSELHRSIVPHFLPTKTRWTFLFRGEREPPWSESAQEQDQQ